ncbi:PREDICTED: ELL-associated factor 1-like [Priapulus caudatus]|uniref:Ell-associated factor Eaf n=1 Tax=Priapulus caudatus TaxID=37621 RepID=A0ABM1ENU1_PRICU|nr:PREDICTED: ELL-associated factor 1-like [Priapulus caudatus]
MADLTLGTQDLKLGASFAKNAKPVYHTVRYDFRSKSVDTTKVSDVEVGEGGNEVTVTVPHVEGAGTNRTVYKGFKKPCHKECILIIDHATGEIKLEKLGSNIQLKKTRAEGSSKVSRPTTPVEGKMTPPPGAVAAAPVTPSGQPAPFVQSAARNGKFAGGQGAPVAPAAPRHGQREAPEVSSVISEQLSNSSSSGSDSDSDSASSGSDSDMETVPAGALFPETQRPQSSSSHMTTASHSIPVASHENEKGYSQLSEDLQLSESGSDSDSD